MITKAFVDKTEYSRYYAELSVITVTVLVDTPIAGSTLTVDLVRLDGYGIVATKQVTQDTAARYQVMFDLVRDALDAVNIYRAKAGDYAVVVTDQNGTSVQSDMFAISIVPVKEIIEQWAKGVTFYDYEVLKPRMQPQIVTGVEVTEVTANHYKGPFPLALTVNDDQTALSWNGGTPIPINGPQPQELLLLDQEQQDYIMVRVDPSELPTQSVTETLVIENGRITERAMIEQVRKATNWVQQQIIAKVEPNIVDTDPGANFADEIGIPETYYRPNSNNKWLSFKLPYPRVLDVSVSGWFNQAKTADVPREWLVCNEMTGIVELVPSTATQVTWSFYNGVFVMAYLTNYPSIPSFWHYRLTCGMRDLWNERGVIREAIAKKAVTELLNTAGSSYRAGYASQSTSRDGVSESAGYTSSAMYGTYGGHFSNYLNWLEKEIPKMKKRFTGVQYVTI